MPQQKEIIQTVVTHETPVDMQAMQVEGRDMLLAVLSDIGDTDPNDAQLSYLEREAPNVEQVNFVMPHENDDTNAAKVSEPVYFYVSPQSGERTRLDAANGSKLFAIKQNLLARSRNPNEELPASLKPGEIGQAADEIIKQMHAMDSYGREEDTSSAGIGHEAGKILRTIEGTVDYSLPLAERRPSGMTPDEWAGMSDANRQQTLDMLEEYLPLAERRPAGVPAGEWADMDDTTRQNAYDIITDLQAEQGRAEAQKAASATREAKLQNRFNGMDAGERRAHYMDSLYNNPALDFLNPGDPNSGLLSEKTYDVRIQQLMTQYDADPNAYDYRGQHIQTKMFQQMVSKPESPRNAERGGKDPRKDDRTRRKAGSAALDGASRKAA